MGYFKPNRYYKTIYDIDYNKLKNEGIKCLIFDLDNTLGLITNSKCPKKTKDLLNKLKSDFDIYICSNNTRERLLPYMEDLGVLGVWWSMKPSVRGPRKIRRDNAYLKSEMAIIGDQIVTDIFAGKRYKIMTILVDPLGTADLKITGLNRKIEKIIVDRYTKKKIFKRGSYYE